MNGEIKIGYSTGPLRDGEGDRLDTRSALRWIRSFNSKILELGQRVIKAHADNSSDIQALKEDGLEGFEWVSLHAPKHEYGRDQESRNILDQIKEINRIRPLDLMVVHPDLVKDFSIFEEEELPVAFENSDHRKESYKNVEDMIELTSKNPNFKVCIDVNHVWTVDPSMDLAESFFNELGDKIKEIHVSGYQSSEKIHYPLYRTLQPEIVRAIKMKHVPLIIESTSTSLEEMNKERDYILEQLK